MDTDQTPPVVISRQDALVAGLKFFFTGKICKRGHLAFRKVNGGDCVACAPIRFKKWILDNPERAIARNQRYEETRDKDAKSAINKKWREKNKEYLNDYYKARNKQRRKNNPEAARLRDRVVNSRRRALEFAAEGSYTAEDILRMLAEQNGRCATPWCAVDLSGKHEVDHKTPLTRGGGNDPANLHLLCRSCNARKHDRLWEEWLALGEQADAHHRQYAGHDRHSRTDGTGGPEAAR